MKELVRYYERLKKVRDYDEAERLYWAVLMNYEIAGTQKADLISAIETVKSEIMTQKWGSLK